MATSLMLRDQQGNIRGYVLLMDGQICCRMTDIMSDMLLHVNVSEGVQKTFALTPTESEQCFLFEAKTLISCFVSGSGDVIAASDVVLFSQKKTINQEIARKTTPDTSVYTEEETAYHPFRELPTFRWPPPPCWKSARYVKGRWTEEGG